MAVNGKQNEFERLAAGMLAAGFVGTEITPHLIDLIDRGVGCVVLFARNISSPAQAQQLTAAIKQRAGRPIAIAVDQEGGRVRRFREGFAEIPAMRELGRANDADLAIELGRVMARELRAVNIDIDFAPCLDVDTNPLNPVIADRSIGPTPQLVSELGAALIEGLQSEGVAACGKHFPGHGDTSQDSHHHLPRLDHNLERLLGVELVPFEAAVRAGIAALMTSHVIFSPLDPIYPATMSPAVMQVLLRDRLGFDGVVISDDLEMKAVAAHFEFDEIVLRGIAAGVDLFCIAHTPALQLRAIEIIARALQDGTITRERVEQSIRRRQVLEKKFVLPPVDSSTLRKLDSDPHRSVLNRVRSLANGGAAVNGNGHPPANGKSATKVGVGADPTETWRVDK